MASSIIARLRNATLTSTSRTSDFLTHLVPLLSQHPGISASLSTLFYTLSFVHANLTQLLTLRYEALALDIASRASATLLPGETVVAEIDAPHLTLRETCVSIANLRNVVNDVRMFLRLGGLLRILAWAKETYAKPPRDVVIKTLVWAQVGVKAAYQVLENGAFLVNKGVLRGEKWVAREARLWQLSTRFWLAYISLEGLRLLRVRQLKFNEDFGAQGEVKVQSAELQRKWTRQAFANAGWIIPTWNWDVQEDGLMPGQGLFPASEAWVGLSGLIPSILALQDAWREVA